MNLHRRLRADDGFSVAEVVIAAAILFFVLTAIVGLVGLSSSMTVQAKNKAMLTNAVASYIERVRSLKWAEIDAYVSTPREVRSGTSTVTVVASVYTSTTADGQEFLKTIELTATATMDRLAAPQTYAVRVSLRNPDASLNLGGGAPIIDFDNSRTPPEYCILYDNSAVNASGTAWAPGATISTVATSPGGVITEVSYRLNGAYLRDQQAPSGTEAIFAISPPAPVVSREFRWYTNQVGELDGFQTVEVEATDDVARHVTAYRTFILDNQRIAAPPSSLNGWVIDSRSIVATWPAVRDGGPAEAPCYASYYPWRIEQESHSPAGYAQEWPNPPVWGNPAVGMPRGGYAPDIPAAMRYSRTMWATMTAPYSAVRPFSRLRISVLAAGPRGIASVDRTYGSRIYIGRPEIFCNDTPAPFGPTQEGGHSTVLVTKPMKYVFNISLKVSQPHFVATGVNYTSNLQFSRDLTNWMTIPPGDLASVSASVPADMHKPATVTFQHLNPNPGDKLIPVLYYRAGVTFTPPGSTTTMLLNTNAVGPTPELASSTVYELLRQKF